MTSTRNIYFFLFLSLLLHAGFSQWLDSERFPRMSGSTIAISLLPPDSQNWSSLLSIQSTGGKSVSQVSGQSLKKNVKLVLTVKPDQLKPSAEENRIQQPGHVVMDVNHKSDASTSQSSRIQALKTGNQLKRMLQDNMVQYFSYPRFALKRGWQGEVTIGIRIEPNGYISRAHLVHSSGYNSLDLAALAGARKVKSLPKAVALLHGQAFDLELPVIYRLRDS